jgi:MYXO-CTERM domain-containing protein
MTSRALLAPILLAISLAAALSPSVASAEPQVSPILFLNRCKGGCTVHTGIDDARANSSSIPCPGGGASPGDDCPVSSGDVLIEEFQNSNGEGGAAADAEWAQVMQCVRELYSPYAITVTDTVPAGGLSHNQGIVAGRPVNIGWSGIGGVAPGGCNPRDNVISFTFANIYGGADRIYNICAVVGQETAHAYGLDHAYAFSDGRTACPDPMSYRSECGGQRFFRNDNATCGEFSGRPCMCGGFQNSHLKILAIFGPGTPITRPPSIIVSAPTPNSTVANGATVLATASAQRGIAKLELWLNGYRWLTVKGAPFGLTGQPETTYPITFPSNVPDGIIDIVIKAYDDINVMAEAPPITVTKGAPCADASTCAKGQACDAGRCLWEAPSGVLGDSCGYPQFCQSELCVDTTDGMVCSEECVVGVADSCPAEFTCAGTPGQTGFCVSKDAEDPGCCSTTTDPRGPALFGALVLMFVTRRRRRR